MKSKTQQQKDFYLIAKKIKNQQKPSSNDLQQQLDQRYKKQAEEALKMINAYRKVENVKSNTSNKLTSNSEKQKQLLVPSHQPKSSYANKIKETLRQLNANKAKQYQKLSQKNTEQSSSKNINSLQVNNQMGLKAKSQNQRKLVIKSTQKIWNLFHSIVKRRMKQTLKQINQFSQKNLQKDYQMSRKYRLFRLFSLWKEETNVLKIQNQRNRKQLQQKQIQGAQMSKEFYIFKTYKKVIKHWSKVTKNQKKKRKYQQELAKVELQQHMNKKEDKIQIAQSQANNSQKNQAVQSPQSQNGQLQNKLRGFLDGLKEKIENKDQKPNMHSIQEQNQQSQKASAIFSDPHQDEQHENQIVDQQHEQIQQQDQNPQVQSQSQPQRPLSNEQLQKRRQQIFQRSKNRKQALQKLKKEKDQSKKKQDQERKQLQKKIEEQQKRIKELKYKEFQQRKRLQKEWQQRQIQLNVRVDAFNRLRILKNYGFEPWKNVKAQNELKAQKLKQIMEKVMIRHAGSEFLQNLEQNLQCVLSKLYFKMDLIYERVLKKKVTRGFKIQLEECLQQKVHLQAFHQVHIQREFLSQWRRIVDTLRLQNMQEQRPLLRKANDYHKVMLMMKSFRELKQNAIECKKEKNINEQKIKIRSKIKNIISEKIQINYDQFL